MNKLIPVFTFLLLFFNACKSYQPSYIYKDFPSEEIAYNNLKNWAAHPDKKDPSDRIPENDSLIDTSSYKADVFFIHPTTYIGNKGQDSWNSSIDDSILNTKTDVSSILYQASAFNKAGRVFAPRYRQAHLYAYSTDDKESAKKAFTLAYKDVKQAFLYYLKHYNNGRPIIIASHSQGTTHAGPLMREFFDGKPLQKQLVAAYLIGLPVPKDYFKEIIPCENPNDIVCFTSWRTYKKGYLPKNRALGNNILVTNPLSWKTDSVYMSKEANLGAVLRKFDVVMDKSVDAQVHNGILWATKPKFPGSFLFTRKNYHIADINFYYFNIQENAIQRVKAFLEK